MKYSRLGGHALILNFRKGCSDAGGVAVRFEHWEQCGRGRSEVSWFFE